MSLGRRDIGALIINLVAISYASGYSNRRVYTLPALPEMADYLNDVIVLPRNHDAAEVLVIDLQSHNTLVTCSVTNENEFRLSEANCSLPEVKPGMALRVSVEATVLIVREKYSLPLPIIEDLGQEYFLITIRSDESLRTISNIFIYPSKPNTSLQICINQADKSAGQMNNFSQISPRIPGPRNCSNITLLNYEGLLLNDTAAPFAMEVRANLPFGILEWYRVNASDYVRNRLQFADPPDKLPIIIWRRYPPLNTWSKTFMLPSTDNNLIRKLYLIPENDSCSISILREDDSAIKILYGNLTTVTLDTGGWVYINASCRILPRYRLHSVDRSFWSPWQSLAPLDSVLQTVTSENTSQNYQWILVNESATMNIVCAKRAIEAVVLIGDGQVVLPVNVSEISGTDYAYKVYKVLRGVYRVFYNQECMLLLYYGPGMLMNLNLSTQAEVTGAAGPDKFHSPTTEVGDSRLTDALLHSGTANRESSLSDTISYTTKSNISQRNTLNENLNTTKLNAKFYNDRDRAMFSNYTILTHITDQIDKNKEEKTSNSSNDTFVGFIGYFNRSLKASLNVTNDTQHYIYNKTLKTGNLNNSYSNKEVSEMQQMDNSTLDNSTAEASQINTFINTSDSRDKQQPLVDDNRSRTRNDRTNTDYSSNNKYKAVVDIVQHNDGTETHTINQVPKDSDVHPSYGHKDQPSNRYTELNNEKSLLAIIISLSSALFAVVAIIVLFLLIDFFSKRRQIRKTRIRPFVSYY